MIRFMKKDPYAQLHALSKTAALLNSVHNLLGWDLETYMPKGAAEPRAHQIELIASLVHKAKTSSGFAKLLGRLIDLNSGEILALELAPEKKAALREWRKDYLKAVKLPNALIRKFAKLTSHAVGIWAEAKRTNQFSHFSPLLEKIVALSKKKADLLGYSEHPYDALLDLYEPGLTVATLSPLFERLKTFLIPLLKNIRETTKDGPSLKGPFPKQEQLNFAHFLLKKMGFKPSTSRLDESVHPFCTSIHIADTRMTTHVSEEDLLFSIFSVIHEGGHGLYNQGLPQEYWGSPLAESLSFGIDESQSRLWETIIGHSISFWTAFYPHLQKEFPQQLESLSLDQFYRMINRVGPSLIRIHADEVSYSLHIILRFEVEKKWMEGSLSVKELPNFWREKMREYFGIVPPTDSEGCLQDIHWAFGYIGYFPSYTLGNLYAAQFFEAFTKAHPQWEEAIKLGELDLLREWLKENIHRWGRQLSADELIVQVSQKKLTEEAYISYLKKKYLNV